MILLDSPVTNQINGRETSELMSRLCEHLGIAFSANRVYPSLADLTEKGQLVCEADPLNVIGKHFGIRFRAMSGSLRDLMHTVSDSGPVIVWPGNANRQSDESGIALILSLKSRNQVVINQNGADRTESTRWLRRNLEKNEDHQYQWLLAQPLLAAGHASRVHYQGASDSTPLKPLRRFIELLRPEASDIRTILVFSVVIGLLSLTLPLAVEAVVNTIAFGRYLQPLIVLSLIVLTFLLFRAGLSVLMTVVTEIVQRKLFVRSVEDLSYRLTRVPLSAWRAKHGPELVNRFFDIVTVQKVTSKLLLETVMLALQTIIGLSVLAFYHPFLLGYDIGLLVMMTIILYFIGRGAVRTATEESQAKYETAAWLQEMVRHPTTYKFNGGLGYAINRADELTARYINHRTQHFKILIRQFTFAMLMQAVAATILLALGGYLVIQGQMTLGQLVAAELIVTVILGSFAKLGKDLESFYDLMASVDKLGKLFDLPVEPVDKLQLTRSPGAYEMSLIDLKVGNASVSSANLTFERGKTHSVYGASELQRSRLIEILVGQVKPETGHVLLNDYRVDSIAAESLQAKVSLVRDIELFDGTVDENLRLGRANIGSAQANAIVNQLGLRQTIAALPEGFSTRLNVSGYPLSPGQSIRLVIARALISKPGILFIDGLLDRLGDDDLEDFLPLLEEFTTDTTFIIATGRRQIAKWAEQCLDLRGGDWKLEKFEG